MGAADVRTCEKLEYARSLRPRPPSRASGLAKTWWRNGWRYMVRKAGERVRIANAPAASAVSQSGAVHRRREDLLGLQPGDVVEVRSAEEILATLDDRRKLRGLGFQPEMYRYCGQRMVVLNRVERIFVEATGNLKTGIRGTVLLDGAVCDGSNHGGCDARCYHLWREAWLRRCGDDATSLPAGRDRASAGGPGTASGLE